MPLTYGYGGKRKRYQHTWNDAWVAGAKVHLVGAHSKAHQYDECTIKRVLKTGHAVIDWTNHAGVTVERKFRLGNLTFAQEMKDTGTHYIARIHLVTAERLKNIADSAASQELNGRINTLRDAMQRFQAYHCLTEEQMSVLEGIFVTKKEENS